MIHTSHAAAVVAPTGDYDVRQHGWLPAQVAAAVRAGESAVHIDLDRLDFAGSTLINDVVACRRLCRGSGTVVTVSTSRVRWARLFELGALAHVVELVAAPTVPRQQPRSLPA